MIQEIQAVYSGSFLSRIEGSRADRRGENAPETLCPPIADSAILSQNLTPPAGFNGLTSVPDRRLSRTVDFLAAERKFIRFLTNFRVFRLDLLNLPPPLQTFHDQTV